MFDRLCAWLGNRLGTSVAFVLAFLLIVAAVGAAFVPGWRETVNTWGGAVTGYASILLLIVLQNGQNRQSAAQAAKTDELVRVTDRARDSLIGAEERTTEEIVALREETITRG